DTAPIPPFPRKRGKGPVHGEKVQDTLPPPLAGEGRGGGRFRSPRSTVSRRTLPPSRPSPASGGRGRFTARRFRPRPLPRLRGRGAVQGEQVQDPLPPPRAGGGRGGGRFRSPRSTVSRRTLPPSRPSPASGGRGRFTARRFRPRPLPRLRGRAGVGAASDRRAQRCPIGPRPHPN